MRRIQSTNNGKRNQSNNGQESQDDLVRLSGNVLRKEKETWWEMVLQAAKIDHIRDPNSGTFLARIINKGLRLDQACLDIAVAAQSEYLKTHKRRRDEDPARILAAKT